MSNDFELNDLTEVFDYGEEIERLLFDSKYEEAYLYIVKVLDEEEKSLCEMQTYINNSIESSQYGDAYEMNDIENSLELIGLQRRKIDSLLILKKRLEALLISLKRMIKKIRFFNFIITVLFVFKILFL